MVQWGLDEGGGVMQVCRTVVVDRPLERVFAYLADFSHVSQWDPGTQEAVRSSGDGGIGTTYAVVSVFAGRRIPLAYTVTEVVPGSRFTAEAQTKTMSARDTMTFTAVGSGTSVTYDAHFAFSGGLKYVAWLLRPAFTRLGNEAEAGLRTALEAL
ncbi:SRPBCC family protein [Segeticoccus rhizosphaerae]|uniref:SRPBCC family protein n=1 Tax=Segeticoccus rhizosphaerae TaxID=1104777 RepID=UPI001EEFA055|nr:SRPBCC family protein [Segeticoccus rhizosphaerae]